MKTLSNFQLWLVGISFGAIAVTLMFPATRWYFVQELASDLGFHNGKSTAEIRRQLSSYALSHPKDYFIQLAQSASMTKGPSFGSLGPAADQDRQLNSNLVDSLVSRFPKRASAYAFAVGVEAGDFSGIEWKAKENVEFGGSPPTDRTDMPMPSPGEMSVITDCLRLCRGGEALEPNNALFPFVSAEACYASHRDDLAEAAMDASERAAEWDDGTSDLDLAEGRVADLAYGGIHAYDQGLIWVELTRIPGDMATTRSLIRMAIWNAVDDEAAGELTRGMMLRRAVMHNASLIRCNAKQLGWCLTGVDIMQEAYTRPGGGPRLVLKSNLPLDQWADAYYAREHELFDRYLLLHHQAAESAWVDREAEAGAALSKRLVPEYNDLYNKDLDNEYLSTAAGIMALSWVLLAIAFWIIVSSCRHILGTGFSISFDTFGRLIAVVAAAMVVVIVTHGISQVPGRLCLFDTETYLFADKDGQGWISPTVVIAPFALFTVGAAIAAAVRKKRVFASLLTTSSAIAIPCVTVLILFYCVLLVYTVRCDEVVGSLRDDSARTSAGQRVARITHSPWPGYTPQPPLTGGFSKL